MRVLVAEDDMMVRYALQVVLREVGHDVSVVKDGGEAIDALLDAPPEALVLDLMMPRVSGFDVLRWLKEHDPEVSFPVIILSAFIDDYDGFATWPHVRAVLEKPLILERLFAALDAVGLPDVLAA